MNLRIMIYELRFKFDNRKSQIVNYKKGIR